MPSRRYLLIEGVDGYPVTDPHAPSANPARYLGRRLHGRPVADPDHVLEHYDLECQVVLEHGDIRRAVAAGHLVLHAETIAKSHDAARAVLLSTPPKES